MPCRYANVRNQAGLTAVHYAVRAAAGQALEVLLRGGANPGLVSFIDCMWEGLPRGSSPLHLAARKNDNALALQLLRAHVSAGGLQATCLRVEFQYVRRCQMQICWCWFQRSLFMKHTGLASCFLQSPVTLFVRLCSRI